MKPPCSRSSPATPSATRKTSPSASRSDKAWSASAPARKNASWSRDVPGDYVKINSSLGGSTPSKHRRPPGALRRRRQSRHRTRLLRPIQRCPPGIPRSANPIHRHRAEHHRRHHADRATPATKPGASRRTPQPAAPVTHHQRRTAGESPTPSRTENRSRNQKPGSRASQEGARRKSRTALAHLQVQERIPRQHEP